MNGFELGKENNLVAKTDKVGNVLIEVPATAGYEDAPILIIQVYGYGL